MSDIKINSIFVIESLSQEKKTGEELFHDIISKFEYFSEGFQSKYISVSNRKEFFQLIEQIVSLTENNNYKPIIHIECHGDEEKQGLILNPSKELITWNELETPLRKINIVLKNSLLITLGVCYGSELQIITDIEKPASFFGLITPKEKIYNTEILQGYNEFYQSILYDKNLVKAVNLLKNNPKFVVYGAEKFFDFFGKIWKENLEESNLIRSTKESVDEYLRKHEIKLNQNEYDQFFKNMYNLRKISLQEELNRRRKIFLMID